MTPEPEEAGRALYAPRETIRILFVDDDPILREFAAVNLAAEHTEIETVADGAAALAAIARRAPDIVLFSLEGPDYETLPVLKALRADANRRATPVIAVTGREDVDAVDAAYAAGATSFVVKPLNWRLLGRQVRFVLRAAAAAGAGQGAGQGAGSDELIALAREGVRFIAQAMAIDPRLKTAALPFAEAADAALEVRRVNGAG